MLAAVPGGPGVATRSRMCLVWPHARGCAWWPHASGYAQCGRTLAGVPSVPGVATRSLVFSFQEKCASCFE